MSLNDGAEAVPVNDGAEAVPVNDGAKAVPVDSGAEAVPVNAIVIGAMKSGTTTLYRDLQRVPGMSIPAKELDFFQRPAAEVTRSAYDALFSAAEAGSGAGEHVQCRLDISTTYSMWPDIADVPERAAELLDGKARLIYMVRNPIDRAVSHHHHMTARGATTAGFEQYLLDDPGVMGFGRYDIQAKRWTSLFGEDSLLVVRLDDYSSDWASVAPKILAHLGVPYDITQLDPPAKENATEDARVFTGRSRQLAESAVFKAVYRNGIRRVLSDDLRTKIRNTILPAPPERPAGPESDVLADLVEQLEPAAAYVAEATGTPKWDLAATAQKLASV
ncbi:MAG: sulfotransferase [Acidimicrobiales bacterium]